MYLSEAFLATVSKESKNAATEMLQQCEAGFLMESEDSVRVAVVETYVDFLKDNKVPFADARDKVAEVVNRMVERYNCGTPEFLQATKFYLQKRYSNTRFMQNLEHKVVNKLSTNTKKFMSADVIHALESFTTVNIQDEVPAQAIAQSQIERFGKDIISHCFPEDFQKALSI